MKIRTVAFAVGGAVLIALGGVGAVACSSDDGSGTPTPGNNDKDATTAADTGKPTPGKDGSVVETDSDTPVGDAGTDSNVDPVDCGKVPTFHPVEAGTGPYCPFSAVGDAGNLTCAATQHCCEHPADAGKPSECQAAACAKTDTDWMCQDKNNCPGAQVCCAVTTGPGQDPGCSFYFLHKFTGTACRTACAQGELTVCEGDDQCVAPAKCQHVTAKGGQFGFCQ
jgi:hypothetical protein